MEENQDFCVNGTRFSLHTIKTMCNNPEFSDIVFLVNGRKYFACKNIMAAVSDVLKSLCGGSCMISIDRFSSKGFFIILKYIYGFDINVNKEDQSLLCEILHLADYYQISELVHSLKKYLNCLLYFEFNSIIDLLNVAKDFRLDQLYEKLFRFVCFNGAKVLSSRHFVQINQEVLLDLLISDRLIAREVDILSKTLLWYKINCTKDSKLSESCDQHGSAASPLRSDLLLCLLKHIRPSCISFAEFKEIRELHPELYQESSTILWDKTEALSTNEKPRCASVVFKVYAYYNIIRSPHLKWILMDDEKNKHKPFSLKLDLTTISLKMYIKRQSDRMVYSTYISFTLKYTNCLGSNVLESTKRSVFFGENNNVYETILIKRNEIGDFGQLFLQVNLDFDKST